MFICVHCPYVVMLKGERETGNARSCMAVAVAAQRSAAQRTLPLPLSRAHCAAATLKNKNTSPPKNTKHNKRRSPSWAPTTRRAASASYSSIAEKLFFV